MRSVVYFNDFITEESIGAIIARLEVLPEVDLFINSGGGTVIGTHILTHFLNSHPDIDIYMIGDIGSSITILMLNFIGNIYLTKELETITLHAIDRSTFQIRDAKERKLLRPIIDSDNANYFQNLKKHFGFTDAEIKKLSKGEDIIIYQGNFERFAVKSNIWLE